MNIACLELLPCCRIVHGGHNKRYSTSMFRPSQALCFLAQVLRWLLVMRCSMICRMRIVGGDSLVCFLPLPELFLAY